MAEQESGANVTWEVRVAPGCTGSDPNAPDWQVCELEDGEVSTDADVYDNLTLAEAKQIASMWTKKKEDAGF